MALDLVIYGDFNCPFSALASDRAARLEATGRATVDWRAVEHDRSLPARGLSVDAVRRRGFEREIATIREQLRPGESLVLEPPDVYINTATLNASYAAVPSQDRSRIRQRLFDAYWRDSADMHDPATVAGLPDPADGAHIADRWQAEWGALDRPIVPAMLLPDGRASRGLGVLARLAEHLDALRMDTRDEGGDARCWANLFVQ